MITRKQMLDAVRGAALMTATIAGTTNVAMANQTLYKSPSAMAAQMRVEQVREQGHAAVTEALLALMKNKGMTRGAISFDPAELDRVSDWARQHPGYAIATFEVSGEQVAFAAPADPSVPAVDAVRTALMEGSWDALDSSKISQQRWAAKGITSQMLGEAVYELDGDQVEDIQSQATHQDQRRAQMNNAKNALGNAGSLIMHGVSPKDVLNGMLQQGVQSIFNHGR